MITPIFKKLKNVDAGQTWDRQREPLFKKKMCHRNQRPELTSSLISENSGEKN
jgi:hypothetical protein